MKYRLIPHIRTPDDLGVACIGNPHFSVAPVSPQNRIGRAEYGRRLTGIEGGIITSKGYLVPIKSRRRK